tara:strand:- start:2588 stop:3460 length:873 start_codon:yes stop_codon:yes gene_type:complete
MFVEETLTLIFLGLYLMANLFGGKFNQPIFKIIAHWFRWLAFAFGFSYILVLFEWSSRPLWLHLTTGMAVWFVAETIFYRISIQLLNLGETPLFPNYKKDNNDELWPINKEAITIKAVLSKTGFKKTGVIGAHFFNDLIIRQATYLNKEKTIRINIIFIPNAQNEVKCFFSILSIEDSNNYLITDNQTMPFGGYYPANWSVGRHPLNRSLDKLLKVHQDKMGKGHTKWNPLEEDPLDSINICQRSLERKNQEMGFLFYHGGERKEKISPEGCVRICMEMWLLSYFGKTFS